MSRYQEALKRREQAERDCVAELFYECSGDDPHVWSNKLGRWLTKDEVYTLMKTGVDEYDLDTIEYVMEDR